MLERQRIDEAGFVRLEIVVVDRRAAGLQVGGDVARQRAFIVFARAAVAQALVGLAEIAELEVAHVGLPIERRHAAAVGQVVGLGRRELREMLRPVGDHHLHVPVELHAALGEQEGGRHHVLPLERAEALERLGHAGDLAGHGDRVITDLVPLLEDVGPGEGIGRAGADDGIVLGVELLGRERTVIDRPGAAFLGAPDRHETDAADAAHPRLDRADRHAGGDGGVDRIAALAQDLRSDLSRSAVLRNHHTFATYWPLGDSPLLCQ